jgi:NTP pyrophosphatase (non-canonical NTP hydrolase)
VDLNEYQRLSARTAIYPDHGQRTPNAINYCALKLCGEAGEVAEAWGKGIRDREPTLAREKMRFEIGDVLWYVAQLANELGMTLEDVAQANLDKLDDRRARGRLTGSGDKR